MTRRAPLLCFHFTKPFSLFAAKSSVLGFWLNDLGMRAPLSRFHFCVAISDGIISAFHWEIVCFVFWRNNFGIRATLLCFHFVFPFCIFILQNHFRLSPGNRLFRFRLNNLRIRAPLLRFHVVVSFCIFIFAKAFPLFAGKAYVLGFGRVTWAHFGKSFSLLF